MQFFDQITEAIPFDLSEADGAAELDLALIDPDDFPVSCPRPFSYMDFLAHRHGIWLEYGY